MTRGLLFIVAALVLTANLAITAGKIVQETNLLSDAIRRETQIGGQLQAYLKSQVREGDLTMGIASGPAEDAGYAAALRAQLNEELGFYPANLDDESIAQYRRKHAEDSDRLARYARKYGGPGGSHYNQFRHLRAKS